MDVQVVDRTNRRETQTPAHQAPPCTLVIFGAGGDLTRRLLMPAIYNLSKAKLLSDKFAIIAVRRTPKPVEAYRDYLGEGIRTFVSDTASAPATEPFDDWLAKNPCRSMTCTAKIRNGGSNRRSWAKLV
jgi:hypothetical protein